MSTPRLTPLPAAQVLDRYFLEARSKLLDLAAILDRISRGRGATDVNLDPRMEKVRQAIARLLEPTEGRAEGIQKVFSIAYEGVSRQTS